jgi:hypothetical protein
VLVNSKSDLINSDPPQICAFRHCPYLLQEPCGCLRSCPDGIYIFNFHNPENIPTLDLELHG